MFKKSCALNTQPIHNERYAVRGESFRRVKLQPFGEFKADLILSHICHNRMHVWWLASEQAFDWGNGAAIPVEKPAEFRGRARSWLIRLCLHRHRKLCSCPQ